MGQAASDATTLDRTNEHTAGYAAACLAVAKEMGVPCVDLYTKLQQEKVWQKLGVPCVDLYTKLWQEKVWQKMGVPCVGLYTKLWQEKV